MATKIKQILDLVPQDSVGRQIKIEVNQTKRGIIGGDVIRKPVCDKVQEEFGLYCETDIVPMTLLYGGKIAAALSRQHPRDLFDVKYMEYPFAEKGRGCCFAFSAVTGQSTNLSLQV